MDVSIPKELEAFVREQVESGSYESPGDVLEDGIRLLKKRKEQNAKKLEELKKEIKLGTDQLKNGEGIPFDVDEIVRLGKERKKNRQCSA